MPSPDRLAYPIPEALERVPIGRTTLYRLISAGTIRTITIGARRLIPAEELAKLASQGELG